MTILLEYKSYVKRIFIFFCHLRLRCKEVLGGMAIRLFFGSTTEFLAPNLTLQPRSYIRQYQTINLSCCIRQLL